MSVDADSTLRLAEAADARRRAGYGLLGPLDGVPVAIKDLCDIEGQIATAGSQAWRQRRGTTTSTAVARLLAGGMVPLGKLHMVEFAFGGWGTNPVMGTPRNPWDLKHARIPGGSSSGSGVAVAAGLAPAALGSDTGGSVRIPAALNGVTGLKTTRGLISLHGAVPLSGTLDSIGPLTRDVRDALLLTQAMAGADPRDPLTQGVPAFQMPGTPAGARPLRGMRIAMMPPAQYPIEVDGAVLAALDDARRALIELGAEVCETPFPFDFHDMMLRNGVIIAAEAYALHREYIEDASLPFGKHVRARVLAGKATGAADYVLALQAHARCLRGLGRMDARCRRAADALPALRRLPPRRRRRNGDAAGGLHARRQLCQRVRPGAAGRFHRRRPARRRATAGPPPRRGRAGPYRHGLPGRHGLALAPSGSRRGRALGADGAGTPASRAGRSTFDRVMSTRAFVDSRIPL